MPWGQEEDWRDVRTREERMVMIMDRVGAMVLECYLHHIVPAGPSPSGGGGRREGWD